MFVSGSWTDYSEKKGSSTAGCGATDATELIPGFIIGEEGWTVSEVVLSEIMPDLHEPVKKAILLYFPFEITTSSYRVQLVTSWREEVIGRWRGQRYNGTSDWVLTEQIGESRCTHGSVMVQIYPKVHELGQTWVWMCVVWARCGPKAQRKWRFGGCLVNVWQSFSHLESKPNWPHRPIKKKKKHRSGFGPDFLCYLGKICEYTLT